MRGVHQPLLEMHFQEPELTCQVVFQDKSGINPFDNVRRKNVNFLQEIRCLLCNRMSLLNVWSLL